MFLSKTITVKILLILFALVSIFHLAILFGLIPYEITWGGRLKSEQEMYVFESISLVINFLMMLIISVYAGILTLKVNPKILRILLIIMAIMFAFNTFGNLFSLNNLESYIFTPITFILSLLCFRLVLKN